MQIICCYLVFQWVLAWGVPTQSKRRRGASMTSKLSSHRCSAWRTRLLTMTWCTPSSTPCWETSKTWCLRGPNIKVTNYHLAHFLNSLSCEIIQLHVRIILQWVMKYLATRALSGQYFQVVGIIRSSDGKEICWFQTFCAC